MPKGNAKNLVPFNERTEDEQREITKKGGIRSGEVRRQKSAARDVAQYILNANIPTSKAKKVVEKFELPESDMNVQSAMIAAVANQAMDGNIAATEYLLNLSGEDKTADIASSAYNGLPALSLGKAYVDIYRDIRNRNHRFYDFKGGRGSLKSSFCALCVIDEIERNPNICGITMRQVKDTLKDSVYAQLVWAIDELGLTEQYKCTTNPMQIVKKNTGQTIYFRGGDDPMKIKSIKPPNGKYIGVVWFEEKDQFKGSEAIRNIQQSVMRGGDDIIVLSSYNTPISARHFINVDARRDNPRRIIHHSYYYDSPREWLGQPFYDEAEALCALNDKAYRHEYLGEAVGVGGVVFENVREAIITDKEIASFDRTYYGLDWGWYPDPTAFIKCSYNSAQRKLYIFDEFRINKTNNQGIADLLREHGVGNDDLLICDSSDNKSIADLMDYGFYALGAEKPAGSVIYSMKWLQGLSEIIIDSSRCPNAAEEFLTYEYERDREGEIITGYPDKHNHFIDAVRYALNLVWRRRGE